MSFEKKKKNGSPSFCSAILNSPKLHHDHHVCSTNLNIPKLQSSNLFWFFSTIFELPKFAISGWLQKSKTSQICIIRFEPFDNRIIIFFFHYTSGRGRRNIQQQNMGQQQQLENHKEVEELAGGRKEFQLNFLFVFLFCR